MQSLVECMRRLTTATRTVKTCLPALLNRGYCDIPFPRQRVLNIEFEEDVEKEKKKFLRYNHQVFPPTKPGEEPRPGFVCYVKHNVKYSPLKMWYIASFIRGMSVDEAIKQLSFMHKKGAAIIKDAILAAQEEAVRKHNIEYKSNMWIAESFALKSITIKTIRKHAKQRTGIVRYRFCNYFLRLEEGKPPKHYYLPYPKTGEELLQDWKKEMHERVIPNTL